MAGQNKIGFRYAQALAGLAGERNETSAVYADMKSFAAAYDGSEDLRTLLKSPVIKADVKISILKAVFGSLSPVTLLFMEKITKVQREKYLGDIAKAYLHRVDSANGIYTVKVRTAAPLTEANKAKVKQLAKEKLSVAGVQEIRIDETVDPELIGGFTVTVGDRQIDTSFANKLKALERSFGENIYVKNF